MRRSTGFIALLTLLPVLLFAGGALAGCNCDNSDCFGDLEVTEAGIDIVRGTYQFYRMDDGKAWFENDAGVRIYHNGSEWVIAGSGGTWYIHDSDQGVTPPASGWRTGQDGDIPLPKISQPNECGGAPEITWVRLSTNPWDGQWVTPDEVITLRVTSSKYLADVQVTIMNRPATLVSYWQRSDFHQYDFSYGPGASDPEGPVTFTLDYEDVAGRPGPRITEKDDVVETNLNLPYCSVGCPDGYYIYDRTPPTVPTRIYPEQGAAVREGTVTLMWMESTDALSGFMSYHVTLRNNDGSIDHDFWWNSSERRFYNLTEGNYTWEILAVDLAGNESSSGSGTFTLDVPDGELIFSRPASSGMLVEGAGCSEVIAVGLSEAPTSDVRVILEWDQQISTEGPEPSTSLELTFTPTSWAAVPICLYAVDDDAYEGWHLTTIWGLTISDEYDFDALNASIQIALTDNDPMFQGVTIAAASESGHTLDIGIPEWMVPAGQEPPEMEGYVLSAAIEIGTPIAGGVSILTAFGEPLRSTTGTVRLEQMLIDEGGHSLVEVASQSLYYDLLRDGFFFSFETVGLEESLYLLTIEYEDGSSDEYLIELMAPLP